MPPKNRTSVVNAAADTHAAESEKPTPKGISSLNLSGLKPPSSPTDMKESKTEFMAEPVSAPVAEVKLGSLSGLKGRTTNGLSGLSGKLEKPKEESSLVPKEVAPTSGTVDLSRIENLINAKFAEVISGQKELQKLIQATFVDVQQKLDRTVDQSADAISRMMRLEEVQQELCLHLADLKKAPSEQLKDHTLAQATSLPSPAGTESSKDLINRLGVTSDILSELSELVGQHIGKPAESLVTPVAEQLGIDFDDTWALFDSLGWIDINRALYMS